MATSAPNTMDGFEEHIVDGESRGALPLIYVTELWLAVVSIFGTFYEASGTNVYSTEDITKKYPINPFQNKDFFSTNFI